jgi:FAD/FMN-containing dehydrogenase
VAIEEATGAVALDEAAIQSLKNSLRGALIRPTDASYEAARRVWNGMIDKRPALIVRCAGPADVIAAVRFAREQHLLVAVRGGGHNVSGNAVCAGGLVIDLSPMRSVRVDPLQRTARAEGGATWGDFDHETHAHGLATTGGAVSSTGIAGLTLGGGVGWLARKYGLTCDNLLSADVVTADGCFVTASAAEHTDLFWGLRGGGGNFGVVTSFEYQLHPVGTVLGGMVLHTMDRARDLARFYRDFASAAPEALASLLLFVVAPPLPILPAHLHGVPLAGVTVCYAGPIAQGEEVVRPLRQFGAPVVDEIGPLPYPAMQRMIDAGSPPGLLNYWKAGFLNGLSDAAIETIVEHAGRATAPGMMTEIFQFDGAVNRIGPEETAFSHRNGRFDFTAVAKWTDPADSQRYITWAREFYQAMEPFTTGAVYVNYLGVEGESRVRAAYGANYERLVALKNAYDPTNLFRLNQNIKPTV